MIRAKAVGQILTHERGNSELSVYAAEANRRVIERSLVLCCSADDLTVLPYHLDHHYRRGYGHPRMWSQYADNHAGVCIVFEKERLHESVHAAFTVVGRIPGLVRVFDGPVDYSDQPPIIMIGTVPWDPYLLKRDEVEKHGIDFIVDRQVRSFHRQIYFTKNTDWKAEAEYRWVVYGVNAEYTTLPVADALVAVILGVDISQADREQILAVAESTGLSVSIANWQGHSFGIQNLFRGV